MMSGVTEVTPLQIYDYSDDTKGDIGLPWGLRR